jgi:ABC-type methionine transport system ATPase subunit
LENIVKKIHVNITATKDQSHIPILWRLGHEFDVIVNILKANIDEDFAWVMVELEGPLAEIQRSIAWLQTTGVIVDPIERSVSE